MSPTGDARERMGTDVNLRGKKIILLLDFVVGIGDIWLDICSLLLPCVVCSETCPSVEKRTHMRSGVHVTFFSHRRTFLISLEHVGVQCSRGKNMGFEARETVGQCWISYIATLRTWVSFLTSLSSDLLI